MKKIIQLIEDVKTNPEFRQKFVGLKEEEVKQLLIDEGYDVSMEELTEAAKTIDIQLSPEELEKIAGGKGVLQWMGSIGTALYIVYSAFQCGD